VIKDMYSLSKKRQVQNDGQRRSVGGCRLFGLAHGRRLRGGGGWHTEHGDLADTTVQGLGHYPKGQSIERTTWESPSSKAAQTFVSALLGLLDLGGLLEDVEDLLGEGFVGQRPGCERQRRAVAEPEEMGNSPALSSAIVMM
jgi:hypothetical protein